ncbi:MAG: asparagine synthase-related protein [Dehalococcoidales bacterium]
MMGIIGNKRQDGAWIVAGSDIRRWKEGTAPQAGLSMGQTSFRTREANMERPVLSSDSNLSVLYEGNLYNRGELIRGKDLKTATNDNLAAGIVAGMLDEEYDGNLTASTKLVGSRLNGDYCLAVSDGSQIMVMRDPAGVRPLFLGEKDDMVAFSSLKKALWELGFRDVKPMRAGRYIVIDANGINADEAWTHLGEGIEASLADIDTAVEKYCKLLKNAVEKRLDNVNRVGVLVSGGVDSCLTAKLVNDVASTRGIEIVAYTAGVKGSTDIDYARNFARDFDIQHKVRYLTTEDVEYYMPVVINSVEERDMVQVEAGIGVYAALDMARKDGIRVIVSGQGPDELWSGYSWYPRVIASEGYEGLEQRMRDDLARADIETLDRENRLAIAHGMEKVFPYVDIDVVKLALSVSPRIKINSEDDNTGKRPHREAAKKLGLPSEYADRGKDAAQHGTGIHDTLDEIAGKHGFTPELVERTGYSSDLISKTKLASSTRYGYRYVEKELWETPGAVQFFIDTIAYKQGLLNEYERTNIEKFMDTSKG